jgi:hypothetical protein
MWAKARAPREECRRDGYMPAEDRSARKVPSQQDYNRSAGRITPVTKLSVQTAVTTRCAYARGGR